MSGIVEAFARPDFIDSLTEQVNAQLTQINTVNGHKAAHERDVDDTHPLVQFADAAARSIEETGAAVMGEAKRFEEACQAFAQELRRGAADLADMANTKLRRIHSAGKALQTARENYQADGGAS